jgi:tRNA uracil 4-sulfurtransferase
MNRSIILCRYGELFLKLGNRPRFEQQLLSNVRGALAGLPGVGVSAPHGRVFVHADEASLEEACSRLARVFGLVSFSPALVVELDINAMSRAAVGAASAALERDPRLRRSFRIEARRSDKRFPLSSQQIAVRLGAEVQKATAVPVDLDDPALVVGVEVGRESAHVFVETRPAPGGLPVGSSGLALLLLSGGIDSPVAGWLAAKRGLSLDAVYFHSPPFVGEKSRDKVVSLARTLARWQAARALHVVHFTETQKRLREAGPAEMAVVLYRRMMMRAADIIADRIRAEALVTGENLGQVASQTAVNLGTIEAASRHLVLRPLVTYDKQETIALARRIGTYDLSILPYEDCCSLFVPPHPSTGARPAEVERAEAGIDVVAEATALAASAEVVQLR